MKGAYKEYDDLASALAEPIIAEPEIHGGIELDESCRFLLLMSRGLYKSLEEATGSKQINRDLALMAVEQVHSLQQYSNNNLKNLSLKSIFNSKSSKKLLRLKLCSWLLLIFNLIIYLMFFVIDNFSSELSQLLLV